MPEAATSPRATRRPDYDPAKHGQATVYTGVCATARVEGTVDGYGGRPPTRVRRYHGLARRVYIEAYREHVQRGSDATTQIGLF